MKICSKSYCLNSDCQTSEILGISWDLTKNNVLLKYLGQA